jgi:hypothetical protein
MISKPLTKRLGAMGQVKHRWWPGEIFLDGYIRFTFESQPAPVGGHAIGRLDMGVPDKSMIFYEFDEPIGHSDDENGFRLAVSTLRTIFPLIRNPRWHLGHEIIVSAEPHLKRWLDESLLTPMTAIRSPYSLYITTPDAEDMAMIRMRCREYTG